MKIKKVDLYVALAAMAWTVIACSLDMHESFWAKYIHLLAMFAVFVYVSFKIEKEEEKENE